MNKKVSALLVTDNTSKENIIFQEILGAGYSATICRHDEVLNMVTTQEFRVIIVVECEIGEASEEFTKGNKTYKLLRNSLPETTKIFRCGFTKQTEVEYLRLPFSREDLGSAVGEVEEVEGVYLKKPVVLVVEDAVSEIDKAKAALQEDFFTIVVTRLDEAKKILELMKGKISGIITDLHFPQIEAEEKSVNLPPAGLSIVAYAVQNNLPVVICSDVNHHFSFYLKDVVMLLAAMPGYHYGIIPFSEDSKNWDRAKNDLKELLNKN